MSEAISIADGGAAAASVEVVVGGWLGMTLLGEAGVLDRVLHGHSPRVVALGGTGAPHARVRVVAGESRAPRWPDRQPSAAVVEWHTPTEAEVQMQCVDASLRWKGIAEDVLAAELRIDPDDGSAFRAALQLLTVMLGVVHRRRLLLHASAVLLEGRVVLFMGESGAGKSTTAQRLAVEGATHISDDAVFVDVGEALRVVPFFGDRVSKCLEAPLADLPFGATFFRLTKDATASHVEQVAERGVALWLSSLMVPAGPPPYTRTLMDLVGELAAQPVRTFAAAPTGPLLPALHELSG